MKVFKMTSLLMAIGTLAITSCGGSDDDNYQGEINTDPEEEITTGYVTLSGSGETNDRINCYAESNDLGLTTIPEGDWTYEIWINADPLTSIGDPAENSGLTAEGACISEREAIFELYLIADEDEGADYAIKYNRLDLDNLAVGTMESSSITDLKFDEWVHVAISRSSTDGLAKFYINGVLIDSSDDELWIIPSSTSWLDINYMYRGSNMNFFKGSMDNIRVSTVDRYPSAFTPNRTEGFVVDDNTLLQVDLDNNLTAFEEGTVNYPDFNKVEIKGTYPWYIKVINTVTWTTDEE